MELVRRCENFTFVKFASEQFGISTGKIGPEVAFSHESSSFLLSKIENSSLQDFFFFFFLVGIVGLPYNLTCDSMLRILITHIIYSMEETNQRTFQ